MSKKAFSDLFRRWAKNARRANAAGGPDAARLRARLGVEQVEDRLAPATLPPVTSADPRSVVSGFQPQVAADPTNPNNLVLVTTTGTALTALASVDGGNTFTQFFSTANNNNLVDPTIDPINFPRQYTNVLSPSVAFGRDGTIYMTAVESNLAQTSGSVVVYSFNFNGGSPQIIDLDPNDRYNLGQFGNNAQVVYRWSVGPGGTQTDAAFNPTIAVDTNPGTYTDPQTGGTVTDTMALPDPVSGRNKAVYVAWNTNATVTAFPGQAAAFNPNAILAVASSDAGLDFTTPVLVNDNGYARFGGATISAATQPQILFTPVVPDQNTSSAVVTPGTITFVWSTLNGGLVTDSSQPDIDPVTGLPGRAAASSGDLPGTIRNPFVARNINEATVNASGPNTPGRTDVAVSIDLTQNGNLTATDVLSDLDVSMALYHQNMDQVQIILTAPNGDYIVLLNNKTNGAGNQTNFRGVTGSDLGVNTFNRGTSSERRTFPGTTFSDEAPRSINDPANVAPFDYAVQPESGNFPFGIPPVDPFNPLPAGSPVPGSGAQRNTFSTLYNNRNAGAYNAVTNPSGLSGTWVVTILDYRDDDQSNTTSPPPTQFLQFVNFHASAYINNSKTSTAGGFGTDQRVFGVTTVTPGFDQVTANLPPVSPTVGLGSPYSVAVDNSLGSFSPYAGRMYLAYTSGNGTDTDVFLIYSDDGGANWSIPTQVNDDSDADNFSEGNRTQFMPTVTVDPATGTVVVMWYDARWDASNARSATYMATSIDGGNTFSTNTYLNQQKTALDQLTRDTLNLEPVPNNIGVMPTFGAGSTIFGGAGARQAVVAYGGQIKPFWAGNLNAAGSSIFTATVSTAAGPRVFDTDMGAVTEQAADPAGVLTGGAISIRDEFGLPATITDGFNKLRSTYNDTFAPDGTRLIDGFEVFFDRPVDVASFDPSDITVLYRAPGTPRDAAIPPTSIPILAVIPVNPTPTFPALGISDNATAFFVQFATPQSSTGTYSWAVGPLVSDRIRTQKVGSYASKDTPLAIPDLSSVESSFVVPPLAATSPVTTVQQLQVRVNITHSFDSDLRISLIGPDGTVVVLSNQNGGSGANYTNTVFTDSAPVAIGDGFPNAVAPFSSPTGYRPDQPLNGFFAVATPISGQWRLRVEDLVGGDVGTLNSWSLTFTDLAGTPLTLSFDGNNMDQDADTQTPEPDNDVFTNPRSVSGVPFTLGLDSNTLPLILPGPHLVSTSMPQNPTASDNLVLNAAAQQIDLTFDRDINPATFTTDKILRITGPVGAIDLTLAGLSITPVDDNGVVGQVNAVSGGAKKFRLTFTGTQLFALSGAYTVEFGPNASGASVQAANRPQLVTVLSAPAASVNVTFDAAVAGGFTAADIVQITGPNGAVSKVGVTVTQLGGNTYRINFPAAQPAGQYVIDFNSTAARPIRVANSGPAIDMNFNAGLNVLRGQDPTNQTVVPVTHTATGGPAVAPITAAPSLGSTVTELPLQFNEDFVITQTTLQGIQLLMNITFPTVQTLDIDLVSPSGVTVRLFSSSIAMARGVSGANFTNTRLLDRVGDPGVKSILANGTAAPFTGTLNPQTPLSALVGTGSLGTWKLRVTNYGANTGSIGNWSLTLPRSDNVALNPTLTGLGEPVADRFSASFRVFTQDPTNPQTQQTWTPVGPASSNETANSARVSTVAVDPADPTGNTVYVAVAGGGVWKSTDFLTTDPNGPHYVPLTDLGPNAGVNVSSLAVYPRKNALGQYDPGLTVVYALTGEADQGTYGGRYTVGGVGVLRSEDGGKTWQVLDSTNNVDAAGNVTLMSATTRDHAFANSTGFRIVVDPNPNPHPGATVKVPVVLYMALSGGTNAGVWRSVDGGDTWQLIQAGNATDVVLAAGSANTVDPITGATTPNGNLQTLYAAFTSTPAGAAGVYRTVNAPAATGMAIMAGGQSNTQVIDVSLPGNPVVQVVAGPTPNGKGRVSLAAPALTGNPLEDSYLKDWLYAFTSDGLYLTKDGGKDWTKVQLPNNFGGLPAPASTNGQFATNDENKLDQDLLFGSQNYNLSIAVDPQNPNIVYLGGEGTNSIRVDVTGMRDSQSYTFFNNSDPGVTGATGTQSLTFGGLITAAAGQHGRVLLPGSSTDFYADANGNPIDFLNLARDFNDPFGSNSPIRVRGIETFIPTVQGKFANDGADAHWSPFEDILSTANLPDVAIDPLTGLPDLQGENRFPGQNIHTIFSVVDPVTGKTRLLYGTDEGVFTGVDSGSTIGTGTLSTGIGFSGVVNSNRNGNLQVSQFYNGAVQPSQFAADLAGAMFYGMADQNGFQVSGADVLKTGNLNWRGPLGDGVAVLTDPTGHGTAFEYRGQNMGFDHNSPVVFPNDFFRVISNSQDPAFSGGDSQTGGASGNLVPAGEFWLSSPPIVPAVNPLNQNALLIGSVTGRVYRTTDQGNLWDEVATAANLDGSIPQAVAFGASDPANPFLANNFLYAGTSAGNVFVRTDTMPWTPLPGLSGGAVVRIVPNPQVGSKDVVVVTTGGVFYKQDGTNPAGGWTLLTGNLFGLTRSVFGNAADTVTALQPNSLTSLAVDWRFAVPDPANPNHTFPIIYVGGEGGVFQLKDYAGLNWTLYPSVAGAGAPADGGYLPNTHVTDLDLSIGDIDPATGTYKAGGLNMLVATTYGRGQWAVRLDTTGLSAANFVSGPQVVQLINPNPAGGPSTALRVKFSGPVDPSTFTADDVTLTAPGGIPVHIQAVNKLSVPDPATGIDPRDFYEIVFDAQTNPGSYALVIGASPTNVPLISDPSGNLMNQDGDSPSAPVGAGPGGNGEATQDQFRVNVTLNSATNNSLVVTASPGSLQAGVAGSVTVEAHDSNGNLDPTFNGPITLTPGTNTGAFTPMTANMVNGVATFNITFQQVGTQTVNVAFSPSGVLNPTSFSVNVTPGVAVGFRFDQTNYLAAAGETKAFTLTAVDQFGNATTFNGPVTITSTGVPVLIDDSTVVPPNPPAPNGNPTAPPVTVMMTNGVKTFFGEFDTKGTVQLMASSPGLTPATAFVSVNAGPAVQFVVTVSPGPFAVGEPVPVTVQALDANGNITDRDALGNSSNGQAVTVAIAPGGPFTVTGNPVFANGVASFSVTFGAVGTYTVSATRGALSGSSGNVTITAAAPPPTPTDKLTGVFAVGTGMGGTPALQVFNADGSINSTYIPFPGGYRGLVDPSSLGFTGGLRVAVGDVTGDNVPDYVVGTGPGITAFVRVIDGKTGQPVLDYQPFENFTGGVFVAVGDITGDGISDIVITPDEGGGPRVTILSGGDFNRIGNFLGINDPNFRGGARAGVGDINGDGFADLVISAGFGGGPRVSIFDGANLAKGRQFHPVGDFFMFEDTLRNGVYVAVGDVDGDGFGDIIGGAGPGGAPRVLTLSGKTLLTVSVNQAFAAPLTDFFAGNTDNRGGIRVATKNLDGDRFTDIIVGDGENGGSHVTAYRGSSFLGGQLSPAGSLFDFDALAGYTGGVFVG